MTRATTEPGRLQLSRHHVRVDHPAGLAALLDRLAAQLHNAQPGERAVAVNVGEVASERFVLFCQANVSPALLAAETLLVDVAGDRSYRAFVRSVIAGSTGVVVGVRESLRFSAASSLAGACGHLCQQLDVLALMADGYALQVREPELLSHASALAAASRAFRESIVMYDDNVRGMDDLHYEIAPVLERIDVCFR